MTYYLLVLNGFKVFKKPFQALLVVNPFDLQIFSTGTLHTYTHAHTHTHTLGMGFSKSSNPTSLFLKLKDHSPS